MSTLTSLISAGGGGGTPVNTISQLSVGGQTLYEEQSGGEWLKTGNVLTSGLASYPDAVVKKRPTMSSLSYDSVSYTLPYTLGDFKFNTDGTRLYFTAYSTNVLAQYNLSTPWDLSTLSNSGKTFNLNNFGAKCIDISPDGKYLYGVAQNSGRIKVFELTTPYELNTPSFGVVESVSIQYPQFSFGSTGTANSNFGQVNSLKASSCGNYLYVATSNGMILQLRVPNGGEFQASIVAYMYAEGYTSLGTYPYGGMLFADGENIIVNNRLLSTIQLHSMSYNNISTARFVDEVTATTVESANKMFFMKPDCTKLYMASVAYANLYQFSITPEEYIGSPGSANPNEYIKIK